MITHGRTCRTDILRATHRATATGCRADAPPAGGTFPGRTVQATTDFPALSRRRQIEVNRGAALRVADSMNRDTTTPREFRFSKAPERGALTCLAFFLFMMLGSALGMAVDPPPNPAVPVGVLTAVFVTFWGACACGAAWMLVGYRHSVLHLDHGWVREDGFRFQRVLELAAVTELRWRADHRDVTLLTPGRPLRIDLSNYVPEEQLWIIRFFRSQIGGERQTGWERFCRAVANPVRQEVEEPHRPLKPDEVLLTRWRIDRLFLAATILCLVITAHFAAIKREPSALLVPIVPVVLGIMLRWSIPKDGFRVPKLDGESRRLFAVLGLWTAAILTAMALRLDWVTVICVAGMTVSVVREMIRRSRQKAQADLDEIPRALQEWEANKGFR